MWLPKKLREVADQGPWLLLGLAVGVAFVLSATVEKISKLKVIVDEAILSGVIPHSSAKQSLAYWLFLVLVGLAIACIFLALMYLTAEAQRRKTLQDFDERKGMAYRTLQGMMRAAYRIRTQTYPAIQGPQRNKTFDRIHLQYEIDKDFNAVVKRRYAVRALAQPLHFWQQSFRVRDAAPPAEYFVNIDFRVRDPTGRTEIVYLPTENDGRAKAVSLYFLPRIEVGEAAREIEISYQWPEMCKSLVEKGEETFNFNYDSLERVGEVFLDIYLEPGTGGNLQMEISGPMHPTAKIDLTVNAQNGWPGFRYSVHDAPAGPQVRHSVLAKWRKA